MSLSTPFDTKSLFACLVYSRFAHVPFLQAGFQIGSNSKHPRSFQNQSEQRERPKVESRDTRHVEMSR